MVFVHEGMVEVCENEGNGFDFSQVFDHIEINEKSVLFPFAVTELGDEYEVDNINEMGNGEWGDYYIMV